MDDKYLDKSIEDNLKIMIEGPVSIDVEQSWEEFEKRLNKTENKPKQKGIKHRKHLKIIVAVLVIIIIATPIVNANKVTAFKDETYQWFSKSEDGEATVISKNTNIKIEPGLYKDLTFEEAQSMTTYNIKYPNYLSAGITNKPQISINAGKYPYAITNLIFENDDKMLLIKQENIIGERTTNTYVPKNAKIKKVTKNDIEFLIIENANNYQVHWTINSMEYIVVATNIKYEELMKIIKDLN
ncbi:protein of unknown function [Desulfonispora thiosulfatigenes DSM 11270]|uniref:DUF4367 domain-containing protein n=1 Tax=Desulfonispora thiosulfatigenes DSM 11270 TaxID=656914 RepID=A0A1W1UY98_DESTI|nr:DUF4367 domain-containing protein [Desulfonispora thiosulfatigenes]SMB86082.1 protein of unknown function [Desulfonispora thiosulfatigenes DSM 11270]